MESENKWKKSSSYHHQLSVTTGPLGMKIVVKSS